MWKQFVFRIKGIIVLLVLSCLSNISIADISNNVSPTTVFNLTIECSPQGPTTEDEILITVAWDLPVPCFDVSSSHTINGNTIHIDIKEIPFPTGYRRLSWSW